MFAKLLLVIFSGSVAIIGTILFSARIEDRVPQAANSILANQDSNNDLASFLGQTANSLQEIPAKPKSLPDRQEIKVEETIGKDEMTPSQVTPPLRPSISPTEAQFAQTPVFTPSINSAGHIFYTSSSANAKYYYCDTDTDWKGLSPSSLKAFDSEKELLGIYSRVLHELCATPKLSPTPFEEATSTFFSATATPTPISTPIPEPSSEPTLLSTPTLTPTVIPTTSQTPEASPNPTPEPSPIQSPTPFAHIYYTSSAPNAKYYYCDTDNGWKSLSLKNLKSFSSPEKLLAVYNRTLHEPCK